MRQKQLLLRLGVLAVGLLLLLALWKHFRELNEPVLAEPVILVPAEREPVHHEPIPPEPDLFEPFIPEPITLELIYPEPMNSELVPPEPVNREPINPEPVPTSSRPTRALVDADILPPAARKPLTNWNLTCPEHSDQLEEEERPENPPLQQAVNCSERSRHYRYEKRGDFQVLYNYIPATEQTRCWESVTYVTHGDLSYLDNLGPLVRRWRGPISVALYTPGQDLAWTLRGVRWARACLEPPLVERYVTFHVLFEAAHTPAKVPAPATVLYSGEPPNCSDDLAFYIAFTRETMYRRLKKLQYPVNMARNVAREAALTHFVLVSDIDMYPSPGLAPAFLEMVRRDPKLRDPSRRVFVVPPFSVVEDASLPEDKATLLQMLRDGRAAPFREATCDYCNTIPKPQTWACAPPRSNGSLGVYAETRRMGQFARWEPFYIGTHDDPVYDERLTWNGMRDKRIQAYVMCLKDYSFHVLDNAFLVHRPGIEVSTDMKWRKNHIDKANSMIASKIVPQYAKWFGKRKGCEV